MARFSAKCIRQSKKIRLIDANFPFKKKKNNHLKPIQLHEYRNTGSIYQRNK